MLGLGIGISLGNNRLGGSSGLDVPPNAIGAWYFDEYQASPRPTVPNSAIGGAGQNLLSSSRGLHSSGLASSHLLAVTDAAAVGPDGRTLASTLVASGADWYYSPFNSPLPAGTYTFACNVKRNTGTDQAFIIQASASASGVNTATSAWQRFSLTFTHAGGHTYIFLVGNGAVANLQLDFCELYAGASDLGPEAQVGHLYLGKTAFVQTGSFADDVLDLSTNGDVGIIDFADTLDLSDGLTMVGLASKVGAGSAYTALLCKLGVFNDFCGSLDHGNRFNFSYNGERNYGEAYAEFWPLNGAGWHSFGHRYDPVADEASTWVDGGKTFRNAAAVAAPTVRTLTLSALDAISGYGGGFEFAGGILLFNRALTDGEMVQAQEYLASRAGLDLDPVRVLVAEGDSITAGAEQYVAQFRTHQSPANIGQITAVAGSTLADTAARLPDIRAKMPASPAPGSKYIFSIMNFNSANYLATAAEYLDQLQAICDTMRDDGWLVAVGTVTPSTMAGVNGKRSTINAAIRTWVGTHCDAVFDFAADATIGTDAAASNPTYYPDGTHPSALTQSTYMEPIYRAAINAL